eukprot:854179_1
MAEFLKQAQPQPYILNQILGTMAEQRLQLGLNIGRIGGRVGGYDYPSVLATDVYRIFPPVHDEGRTKLIRLHNQLLDIYERLEDQCSPLQFNAFCMDPSLTAKNPTN